MKQLEIINIGPLQNVTIPLKRINLFIGPQSSGKSCIMKIASYCAWLEKTIELNQSEDSVLNRASIEDKLISFHNMKGYINEDSFFFL